jgi:hypothetical protein
MESKELQELVKKIFSDKETRSQFMANPNSVLAKFSLTENERKAVVKTYTKLGLVGSNSIQLEGVIEPNSWWN